MNNLGDLVIDGMIILKWILKKWGGKCILDFYLTRNEGLFEQDNEPFGFIKAGELFFFSAERLWAPQEGF